MLYCAEADMYRWCDLIVINFLKHPFIVRWSVCATALAFIKIETTFYQEMSAFNSVYFTHRNKKLLLGLFFSFPTWLSSCDSFIVRKS